MEELAHEADVGDGQAKGLDAGETLFVRECWYLGEKTIFIYFYKRYKVKEQHNKYKFNFKVSNLINFKLIKF